MKFKVKFIDQNQEFINQIHAQFQNQNDFFEYEAYIGDVRSIERNNHVFISPANSFSFMDGGIDRVYSEEIFPGCVQVIKSIVKNMGNTTKLGRPYLPIGSAVAIYNSITNAYLISSPTMFLPHDVSQTNNAYYAFVAALRLMIKLQDSQGSQDSQGGQGSLTSKGGQGSQLVLVCCGLCMGYGRMSPKECAKQIGRALYDVSQNKPTTQEIKFYNVYTFYGNNVDHEQPDNYDNREIKD